MIDFRISGLAPGKFAHLFNLSDEQLRIHGARRYTVQESDLIPDRIEMRHLSAGESALLLNYEDLAVNTPYRSRHAIYVLENAQERYDRVNHVPEVMRVRLLSVRAFDKDAMMVDADVTEGSNLEEHLERFLKDPHVAFIHVHNAKRGCYSGRVDRV